MGRQRRTEEQLARVEHALLEVKTKSEIMQTILMIREPESAVAADAFNGLRKQIAAVSQEHWAHLSQLAQMDVAVRHAQSVDELQGLTDQWLQQAGISRISTALRDIRIEELYDIVARDGPVVSVLQPAYVDQATGRIIKTGRAALLAAEPVLEPNPPQVPAHRDEAVSLDTSHAESAPQEESSQ